MSSSFDESAYTCPILGVLGVMFCSAFFWNSTKSK